MFAGCTEILHTLSPKEVPSLGTKSRIFLCGYSCNQRTEVWKSTALSVIIFYRKAKPVAERIEIMHIYLFNRKHWRDTYSFSFSYKAQKARKIVFSNWIIYNVATSINSRSWIFISMRRSHIDRIQFCGISSGL